MASAGGYQSEPGDAPGLLRAYQHDAHTDACYYSAPGYFEVCTLKNYIRYMILELL